MKKTLCLLLSLILSASILAGCARTETSDESGDPPYSRTVGGGLPSVLTDDKAETTSSGENVAPANGSGKIVIGRPEGNYYVCVKENIRYGTQNAGEDLSVTLTLPDENTVKVVKETAKGVFHSAVFTFDENGSLTGYTNEKYDLDKIVTSPDGGRYLYTSAQFNDLGWTDSSVIPIVDASDYNHGHSLPGASKLDIRPRDGMTFSYDGTRLKGFTYKGKECFLSVNENGLPTSVDLSAIPNIGGRSPVNISYDALNRVSKLEFADIVTVNYTYTDNRTVAEWTENGVFNRCVQTFSGGSLISESNYRYQQQGGDVTSKLVVTDYEYGSDSSLKSKTTKTYSYFGDLDAAFYNFDPEKGYGEGAPDSAVKKDYSISSSDIYPQNAEEDKVYYDENGLPTYKVMIPMHETFKYTYNSSGHISSIDMLFFAGTSERVVYYSRTSEDDHSAHFEFDENGCLVMSCVFEGNGSDWTMDASNIDSLDYTCNRAVYEWKEVTKKQYDQIMKVYDQIYVPAFHDPGPLQKIQTEYNEISLVYPVR
ncbi:MAG: hypothetical protein IJV00_09480 [Clostridia bacterium]|nr:hypothetical protein [Clostridia bacterium]